MTELSLSHSYAFRWQDGRALPARRASRTNWPLALFGIEALLLLVLLLAYIFVANDRVRLETSSRELRMSLTETQQDVSALSLELAKLRSPGELERIAREKGLVAPQSPRYLSL